MFPEEQVDLMVIVLTTAQFNQKKTKYEILSHT